MYVRFSVLKYPIPALYISPVLFTIAGGSPYSAVEHVVPKQCQVDVCTQLRDITDQRSVAEA